MGTRLSLMSNITDYPLLVLAVAFFALWLSSRIGSSILKKRRKLEEDMREDFGVIQSATLTLLGLIIGFTFSMAIGRYEERKNYEEAEANAIGTEYVRADLLPSDVAVRVRALLSNYLEQRILFYKTRDAQQLRQINTTTAQLQSELWSAVQGPAAAQPTPVGSRPCDCGDERVELAGLNAGCLVEPNPPCGLGFDGGDSHLLQLVGWLWC